MIRVRKLVLAIAAATSLTSGMAHALGLGEISLQSSLNQPLDANIELLEIRDLDKAEIIPRLASPEDFSKAGVEREFFLTDLKFTPVILANGKGAIRVTSGKPVREPYLNFLVEVVWPSGRVLREYTLLLDPPLYSPETAIAAAPRLPVAVPAPSPVPVAAPRSQSAPADGPFKAGSLPGSPVAAPARAESRPAAVAAEAISGDQYRTSKNDTLWEIAQRVQSSGSLNQTMLAIQDLNPNAFIGGNINSLKSGQVLRLPDASQVNARSGSAATAEVAEQNSAWREGRSLTPVTARQLDATKRDVAGEAPAQIETKDSLRLVAAEAGKAASGSDKGAGEDSKVLSDKLAVTQESLDTSRRQGEELKERVADLQSQMDKLQKLVQLKDDQLAKLQADLLAQEKQAAEAALATKSEQPLAPAPIADKPAQAPVVAESTPAQPTAPVQPVADAPATAKVEEPAAQAAPAPAAAKPAAAVAPVEEVQPVQVVSETASAVAPEPVSPVDEFLGNPLLVGSAGAGLLIILLGLMALSRRNALKDSQSAAAKPLDIDTDKDFDSEAELPDDTFAGLDDAAIEPQKEPVNAQPIDALAEAESYIAYGKFNQAAEFLQGAINNEPQRADLQLKLMEVLAELGDRDGFQRQEAELQEVGGVSAQIEQIKAKYPAMAAAGFAAGVGHVAEPDDFAMEDLISDAPPAAPQDADDAFDLSLEDLDAEIDEEFRAPASASDQDLDDFALDIDFAEPAASAKDDIDFGLTLEAPAASESSQALKQVDDFSDFDFELEPAQASTGSSDYALPDENEISLELPELDSGAGADDDSFGLDSALDLAEDFALPATGEQQSLQSALAEPEPTLEALNDELDQLSASFDDFSLQDEPELLQEQGDLAADDDEDFDFLSGTDEAATKLDLARAYIDMGDAEGARDILDEVIAEGSESQQQEARELIGKLA
ncbi:FimV/HubP family polar landmark protein [Pseudomonas sp. N040]|uniref:FimV/HubP family polar landmark protein n=1 Tax=Pseudomonas sp. N040 TaxID=2785325 RepID=UPI0018A29725|nr:FimV/HubP family polar landmark protein [Pseudomonas sp. N040]MBF7729180.1 FimV family protein [Pseudomonas sp. N040]MBW7012820.1 LysM peptidoglycan-binding domain-containing protein [Pseudomonas sp. N040]